MADGLNGIRWFIAFVSMLIGLVSLANQLSGNEKIEFGIPIIALAVATAALLLGPALQAMAGGGAAEDHGSDAGVHGESGDDQWQSALLRSALYGAS